MPHTPEKLNLWDRIFNRYRIEIEGKYEENWKREYYNEPYTSIKYRRNSVVYKKIDRLTGSETLYKEYLD